MKNVEVVKFIDVLNSYFTAHTRKYTFFTISFLLRLNDGEHPLNKKIGILNYVTYNIQSEHYTT